MDDEATLSSVDEHLKKQKRFFSFLSRGDVPPIPLDEERSELPNLFRPLTLLYFWVSPILSTGYKRTIRPNDLPNLNNTLKVEVMYERLERAFNKHNNSNKLKHLTNKCKARGETLGTSTVAEEKDLEDYKLSARYILLILFSTFRIEYSLAVGCAILSEVASTMIPLLTKEIINFVSLRSNGVEHGLGKAYGYSIGTVILSAISFYILSAYSFYSTLAGTESKAVLTKALLAKSFKANAKGKHDYPPSRLTTFIGTDMAKLDLALLMSPYIVAAPFTLVIVIALLIVNLGAATGAAFGVLVVSIFVFIFVMRGMVKSRRESLVFTDERVNILKEIANSLKIIKFYSWEDSYCKSATDARLKESKLLVRTQSFRNFGFVLFISITPVMSTVTFLVLYAIGSNKRNPANIFSSIYLISLLGELFVTLPLAFSSLMDGIVSLRRIFGFLVCGESAVSDNVEFNEDNLPSDTDLDQTVIKVENASFKWESFEESESKDVSADDTKNIVEKQEIIDQKESINKKFKGLNDINFSVKKGEFIMVVGSIGTGKTSLLHALSGFMTRTEGHVEVNGSSVFCGTPWVQNATIKQNIVFGKEFDEKKYEQSVFACSLNDDFRILPAGDATEVGERGITLSGGQKSRLSLARAMYANRDIILMDDVLSAVDARVGKHIMEVGFLGLLREKTRILATHQLSFLSYSDRVIYLNGDGSIDIGTVDELSVRNESFSNLLTHKDRDDKDAEQAQGGKENSDSEDDADQVRMTEVSEIREADTDLRTDGRLIESEISAERAIQWKIYKSLLKLGSGRINPVILILFTIFVTACSTFCGLFVNTWLSFWLDMKFKGSDGFYIGIYIMFTLLSLLLMWLQFTLYVSIVLSASRYVNIAAIKRFLHVPMSYMDTTPTGRILNRFTKDTDSADNELVENVRLGFYLFAEIIGTLILSIIYLPWLALALPPLFLIIALVGSYYQASSREIKRLESTQRSLYINNFGECLSGAETIKAYNAVDRFMKRNDLLINQTNEASVLVNGVQRWGSLRIIITSLSYVLLITLLAINRVFSISPASVGLVISYSFVLPNLAAGVIRSLALAENEMTSFERVHEYAYDLPQESAYHIAETKPEPHWPSRGNIVFDNVSMRYREGMPKVLKNVSFSVKGNERIGICGRTGAGKSTIMSTLFRITELVEGKIYIDGIDIASLGLNELRSRLSIIPQESVLFSGNIRKNLDPFSEMSDELLWESLRRAGLIDGDIIEEVKRQTDSKNLHKFHLNAIVESEGSNFSLGEKQLIAFARALVRNSKILVLDEATSSVDYETDARIQKTIVNEFNDCTILCIAHRLRTIIKYDKILVLDKGELKEFESPLNLFKDESSIFRSLCDKSKITIDDFDTN
ncbi:oligomycin resistance ATP-dependent permease Yor1p [[Candida] jaroonii]|uniref:Oligomycin resistance ATP-dependent permease Yor1p n=1 Tax=[Candida] jaroonii TaxID=467808 RepID=A0ACA9YDP0_9ASCO|nr:oligomycin resistance ATP-dependent permease Yor1p [[Candida] jaroonii]